MFIEKFIEYFNENRNKRLFCFKTFFGETFAQQTPPSEKKILSLKNDFNQIVNQTKDAIIVNLYLNKTFPLTEQFRTSNVANIIYVFENENPTCSNYEAKLIFLLHLSKMKLSFEDFEIMFDKTGTIEIVKFESNDLIDLFSKIKSNPAILKALDCVVCDFIGKRVNEYDLDSISIEFFNSRIPGLNGFAGFKKVYVSSSRIEELKDEIEYREYPPDDGKVLLDLYFVQLILNEIIHVLIQIKKDNMNVSSHFKPDTNLEKYNVNENKSIQSNEIFCKSIIFNKKIDFHRTVDKKFGLNMIYLKEFYKDLIVNQLDVTFDIEASGVFVSKEPRCVMGVDIDQQSHVVFE
ncbi:unnamed protein product [Brachionus calyciflorus]|uniref:Uncharacterized protein n=1 Tax=Brachionus calyciflorus TaxID=104777 RepID=A0A813Q5N5_9BILA|nr:unnamed protein product [Brachionus calyciflorus]